MRYRDRTTQSRANDAPVSRCVLLVEDEKDIRELLAELLEISLPGVEVVQAPTAEDALVLMSERHPDLVITDYKLPGMHGLDFLSHVRASDRDLPAILMTAFPDLEIAIRAINEAHVKSFLSKPLDPDQVVRVVRGVLAVWHEDEASPGASAVVE